MGDCIGIDVSKHALEWSVGAEGRIHHTRNEARPIAQLARRLIELDPEPIVVESTGGYERTLVSKLAEIGLPVVVVNPRRVRSFGEGMGFLAKTDAIDARLLALFGEKARPPLRPILQGTDRLLADLVARRRQLVSMIVAEKNRRDTATRTVRRTIDPVIRTLSKLVRDLERQIDTALRQDLERAELLELLQTVPGVGPGVAPRSSSTSPSSAISDDERSPLSSASLHSPATAATSEVSVGSVAVAPRCAPCSTWPR